MSHHSKFNGADWFMLAFFAFVIATLIYGVIFE